MSQVVGVLVAAGGIILAAAIIGGIRGIFKVAGAMRDNTETLKDVVKTLNEYIHKNDTRSELMRKDIQDLKDWRLQVETTNRTVAMGSSGT